MCKSGKRASYNSETEIKDYRDMYVVAKTAVSLSLQVSCLGCFDGLAG